MHKIILYYKFVKIADPETIMFWQRALCEKLNLRGRIIIASVGINGTVGGDIKDVKAYVKQMKTHTLFKNTEYKWSDGMREDFPKLSIKVRDELVTLAPGEQFDVFKSTKGLRPKAWHKYLSDNPDVTILDARNEYESEIGAFRGKNVIKPNIKKFSQIKETLKNLPKDKPIATYCTGDIRCEYLSAYMKHTGFEEVYHLDGGIVKYGQEFKDQGLWDGKCYVFDKRIKIGFSDDSIDIGLCVHCNGTTSDQINCSNNTCNKQVVACGECSTKIAYCENIKCTNITVTT